MMYENKNITNFELLMEYLDDKSLAKRLVETYCVPGDIKPKDAIKSLIYYLIEREKNKHEGSED